MKTQCNTAFPGKTWLRSCLAALLIGSASVHGQVVLNEDFESYGDDFELQTQWTFMNGVGITLSPSVNKVPIGGSKSAKIGRSDDRSRRALSQEVLTGITSRYTVYTYNTNFVNNTRVLSGVSHNDSGTIQVELGIGWFNNATAEVDGVADTWQGTKYQGRLVGTSGNATFNLNNPGVSNRRAGWVKFDVERLPSGVTRYYVDDVLARTLTNTVPAVTTNSLKTAVIGFGLGTVVDHIWFDGVSVGMNHPEVTVQPQDVVAAVGGDATLSVTALNATSYQWRRYSQGVTVTNAYVDIPNATNSTLVISNVTAADAVGWYSVVSSNENGAIGSRAAQVIITVPYMVTQPVDQTVVAGAQISLTASANGAPTLSYQWQKDNVNVAGATQATLTIPNCNTSHAGTYRLVVSNTHGSVTSSNAVVTVFSNPSPDVKEILWRYPATSTGFLRSSGSQARGLAYNPVSGRVLVMSRVEVPTGQINVLDGTTGALLHTLGDGVFTDPPVGGGTFAQSLLAVADDGKIYSANLSENGATTPFKIYRYDNDDAGAEPTLVYQGDPGNGALHRWGDSIAIRGSGADTRILVGSRFSSLFALIDPNTGTVTPIPVVGGQDNQFGLGLAFGAGDTFWAKVNGQKLYHIDFNGNILHSYEGLNTVGPIAVDPVNNRLAANAIETPDNLRLYNISDLNAGPALLDFEFYLHPTDNAGFGTGQIAFGADGRIYALSENQGIIAWKDAPVVVAPPVLTVTRNGSNVELSWSGPFTLQSSTTVDGTYNNVTATSPHSESSGSGNKFFRLISNP